MKLHLTDRSNKQNNSFTARLNSYAHFLKLWHYHPELELILILKSKGTRFIGDSIEKFDAGDVFLIGENLPHMIYNDAEYFSTSSELTAEAIVIHFKKDFLSGIPEMKRITALFQKASLGIYFSKLKAETIERFKRIIHVKDDFEKTLEFIKILNDLVLAKEYKLLSSEGFAKTFYKGGSTKLDSVYAYIFNNFTKPIGLNDVAEIANMNASAFSRLFKKVNEKPFSKYLNEIRIGYSCKLLIENTYSITAVCYESGFNTISNFNKQFKIITGVTPSEYLQKHVKN